jgi:hypothetical protein
LADPADPSACLLRSPAAHGVSLAER